MATSKTSSPNQSKIRYLFYEDLHYIPIQYKDKLWAAQSLIFAKMHCKPLVDPVLAAQRRMADASVIDAKAYKQIFDPKDEKGGGGKAEFIAADWKANPINIHINNIVETNLEKVPFNLYCRATDELAKTKQMKENYKIIRRDQFTRFLNGFNKQIGLPPLHPTEDPFKYADTIASSIKGKKIKISPDGLVDAIKASIEDNEDLALFNEYIYKGDVEIAVELTLNYLRDKARWPVLAESLIPDLRNFNTACIGYWTNLKTGLPEKEYYDPSTVYTSGFSEADGSDMVYWFREWETTFGDFVRMFGANLTEEELKRVFDKNKAQGAAHGIDSNNSSNALKNAAKIRIGRFAFLTQNCQRYAEGMVNNNFSYKEVDFDYKPSVNTNLKFRKQVEEKHYNQWYTCFYIPDMNSQFGSPVLSATDFENQAKYIFDLAPVQDQLRFGDDDRYSKSPLIVWKSNKLPFAEIQERFMGKIHYLWQKYQNEIVQDANGVIYSEEMIQSMLSTIDVNMDDPQKAKLEALRMLKQTGNATGKFLDAEGKHFKPFETYSSGHMEAASRTLQNIMDLYMMMTRSLAISELAEGMDPKPRQSLGGIKLSLAGSNNATFMLEKGYGGVNMEVADRDLKWMESVVNAGESDIRFQYLCDVIGQANGLNLQTIKDIPLHRLGMVLDNVNTDEQKQKLEALAEGLVKAGLLDIEVLALIIKVNNYKYAAVLMILKYKQKQRQIMAQKEKEFAQAMQLKQMDLQIKGQEYLAKAQAESLVVNISKGWDAKIVELTSNLKAMTQAQIKDIMKNNRIEQDTNKAQLEADAKKETA